MRLWGRKRGIPKDISRLPESARDYLKLFSKSKHDEESFVVFDLETTGLEPAKSSILSFAFIRINGSSIEIGTSFEGYLNLDHNSRLESAEIHQVTRGDTQTGLSEEAFILETLVFIGSSKLVGHHVGFDIACVNQLLEKHFSMRLQNQSIDTAQLGARLESAEPSAYTGRRELKNLDALCRDYDIEPEARHSASGDAFTTALLFLKLQRAALKRGIRF